MNSTNCFRQLCGAVLVAALLSGCSDYDIKPLQIGTNAPPFALQLLDGQQAKLDQYAGKAIVMTFMSSWCPCSNESIPLIKNTYLAHRDQNVAFLLIGIQDSRSKFEDFVNKWEVPFPAGFDKSDQIAREYGVSAPPTTVFIDSTGVVKRAFYGNIKEKESEFSTWVQEVL